MIKLSGLKTFLISAFLFYIFNSFSGCCIFSSAGYSGKTSDHFDGETFHNYEEYSTGVGDLLKWNTNRQPGEWHKITEFNYGQPPPKRIGDSIINITFINHSSVLIQVDSLNILTDPVWSETVGPNSVFGIKRYSPPGLRYEDLPPIDIVLISHNHYDHMDLPTLKKLVKDYSPLIITSLGNKTFLEDFNIINTHEMDWWEEKQINQNITIAFVPARHFSMRGVCDRNNTLWGGFVILGKSGSIYFAGDSGFGMHFNMIRQRYGSMHVSLLPIGSFKPIWFMHPHHCSPNDMINAHRILNSEISIPIHWGTFNQGDDGQYEAIDSLKQTILNNKILEDEIKILKPGENLLITGKNN